MSLQYRLVKHLYYVRNKHLDKATGTHLSTAGKSLSNWKIIIIEQVKKKVAEYSNREKEKNVESKSVPSSWSWSWQILKYKRQIQYYLEQFQSY